MVKKYYWEFSERDLHPIAEAVEKQMGLAMDDRTGLFVKLMGIVKINKGLLGALVNSDSYVLRGIYIDNDGVAHISTKSIGSTIRNNNLDDYNLKSIFKNEKIVEVVYFHNTKTRAI